MKAQTLLLCLIALTTIILPQNLNAGSFTEKEINATIRSFNDKKAYKGMPEKAKGIFEAFYGSEDSAVFKLQKLGLGSFFSVMEL